MVILANGAVHAGRTGCKTVTTTSLQCTELRDHNASERRDGAAPSADLQSLNGNPRCGPPDFLGNWVFRGLIRSGPDGRTSFLVTGIRGPSGAGARLTRD